MTIKSLTKAIAGSAIHCKYGIAFCAAVLAGATANAAATYSTADEGATLVVTVDSDGATLDASQVAAGVTKIVKKGAGKLTATPISSYTGDFDIEEGIWCCTDAKQFGATSTTADSGTIYVRAGASIEYAGTNTKGDSLSGKTVHLYGAGATGAMQGAKIFLSNSNTTMADPGFGKNVTIMMHDDTLFYSKNRLKLTGVFDLGGKKLTLYSNAHDLGGSVTNGGAIVLDNRATFMTEGGAVTFAPDCAENAYVEITSGSTLNLKSKQSFANGWTLKNNGGTIAGNTYFPNTKTDFPVWDGPVELSGASKIANYTGSTSIPTTVFNLKEGPISGSGTLAVGPGWLNLHVQENGYSGAVSVTSVGNAAVPAGAGGIGVCGGAPVFTNASSITFNDSARFEFMDAVPAKVGALTFAGDGEQSIKGGSATNRSTIAGLTKTGANTLVVSSPAHFTGKAAVSSGTLKIVSSRPGLFEYHVTPKNASADQNYIYYSNDGYGFCKPWDETYLKHIVIATNGVNENCATKAYDLGVSSGWGEGCAYRNGWWYHGYVWNRSDAPVTWKVWCGYSTGAAIWLGTDHSTLFEFRGHNDNKPAYVQEITLQPGATPIDIFVWGHKDDFWCRYFKTGNKRYGLVYAPGETTFTTAEYNALIDQLPGYYANNSYQDTGDSTFVADFVAKANEFVKFSDDGTGELFTSTWGEDPDADLEALVAMQPVFDDLDFAPGATLDLSNNRLVRIKDLTGSPEVVNAGEFQITNNWTICAADFPKADSTVRHPMTVDGKLVFAEGATFSIDVESSIERNSSGVVVATATGGIVGAPMQAEGLARKWRLQADGNELKLYGPGGLLAIIQ